VLLEVVHEVLKDGFDVAAQALPARLPLHEEPDEVARAPPDALRVTHGGDDRLEQVRRLLLRDLPERPLLNLKQRAIPR